MSPLGNLLTLKSLTFRTYFSVFHCLPALSISRAGEAITKTVPRDWQKLIKLMLRKCTFLPPRSHLIGQFIKRHLVTIRREQLVPAQWLRQYFCQDHGVRRVQRSLQHEFSSRSLRATIVDFLPCLVPTISSYGNFLVKHQLC